MIGRREALIGAGAAAAALVLPSRPAAADARLLQLERRYRLFMDAANAADTDEEADRLAGLADRVEGQILGTPAAGPDGLMVKYRRVRYWADFHDNAILAEVMDAFEADLARLGGAA